MKSPFAPFFFSIRRAALALVAAVHLAAPSYAFARGQWPGWDDLAAASLHLQSAPSAANAQEIDTLNQEVTKLESSDNPQDIAALQAAASKLATLFLAQKRPQDALWALRRGRLEEAADLVENAIRAFLSQMNLSAKQNVGVGVSGSKFILAGQNLRGLLKNDPHWRGSVNNEIFAYEFDRYLGLNRVPVTVARTDEGKEYSLQFVIENPGAGVEFHGDKYRRGTHLDEVYPFDYITDQGDRHRGNSLHSIGRLVLIDNSRIFLSSVGYGSSMPNLQAYQQRGGQIEKRLLSRLYQITEQDLHNRFDALIGDKHIQFVWRRIMEIRAAYPNPGFRVTAPQDNVVPIQNLNYVECEQRLAG